MTEIIESCPETLAHLFATEAGELPRVPNGIRGALLERVERTLGFGPPSGSGGLGTAVKLGAALLIAGIVGGGVVALESATSTEDDAESLVRVVPTDGVSPAPRASRTELPGWFGYPSRPDSVIAGRVLYQNQPVAGARVVLQSYASRAGVVDEVVVMSAPDGGFDFGSRRAATYDVTARLVGQGYGHVRVNSHDPTASSNSLSISLSGCDNGISGVVRDASGGVIVGADVRPGRGYRIDVTTVGELAASDADGRYSLCVPAGRVVVVFAASGYGSVTVVDHVSGWRDLDLSLLPASAIVGRVVRADDGGPVAGARIWLNPTELRGRVRTYGGVVSSNADGRFRFAGVAPGRHTLWAESRPLAGYGSVVVGPTAESSEVVLAIEDRGGVDGRIMLGGKPVPGVDVGYTIDGWPRGDRDITDAAGRFSLKNTGRLAIGFHVRGYQLLSPELHVVRIDAGRYPIAQPGEESPREGDGRTWRGSGGGASIWGRAA